MNFKLRNKYTQREMIIIGLFSLRASVTIPEMVDAISKVNKKIVTRQNVVATVKKMASKLAFDGYALKRTSGLGRGAVGKYVIVKLNGGK